MMKQFLFFIVVCRTRTTGITTDLLWSFDCGDAREDLHGVYNGSVENNAGFSSPDFSGLGQALNLDRKLNQHIHLPNSLSLLTNTSFTMSVWIFLTGTNMDTILSDCNTFTSICIEFVVHNVEIYAITLNSSNGNELYKVDYSAWRVICQSYWIHLAFSFNNATNIMSIYYNGVQMENGTMPLNTFATMKTNEYKTSYIGFGSIHKRRNPFGGLIDQLSISYYVKNDTEILDEATLLCHYNFEDDDINADSGPNNIPAYSESVYKSLSTNESYLLFNSTDSYFQSSGFTLLMSKSYEFTFTFWLRPLTIKSDQVESAIAVVQLASKVQQVLSESYVCFLRIYIVNITEDKSSFRLGYGQLNEYANIKGYTVRNNTWIHVGVSYANGTVISIYQVGN